MSLYSNVYWTKRVLVVMGVLLLICSGINLFKFLEAKFTTEIVDISQIKPDENFQDFSVLNLQSLDMPKLFTELNDSTQFGNLFVNQKYPGNVKQQSTLPFINVYQIEQKPVSLAATEFPKKVAQKFGFDPASFTQLTTQKLLWSKSSKELEMNGVYNLISYKNKSLYSKKNSTLDSSKTTNDYSPLLLQSTNNSQRLAQIFKEVFLLLDINFNSELYEYSIAKVDYSPREKKFLRVDKIQEGDFIRVDAFRKYPNLLKTASTEPTIAAYPGYYNSNNYVILPIKSNQSDKIDEIVELGLYDWPLGQDKNDVKNVQTYYLKPISQAYKELEEKNQSLMSVTDWDTEADIEDGLNSKIIPGRLDIINIDIRYFEDLINRRYIQPVYVFEGQLNSGGVKYRLVYYVPAVLYSAI